jgi:hypothetical protein
VITPLSFWRVLAWIGAELCGRAAVGGASSEGWQDESGASRWGVGGQNCKVFRASRCSPRLAPFAATHAVVPRDEPAAIRARTQP